MKLRVSRTFAYLGPVMALLIVAGCDGNGGGGPSGPSANAPMVSNFQIRPLTPEKANTQVQYLVTATVTDPNDDLIGGRVEVQEVGNTVSKTLEASDFSGSTLSVVLLTNPVPPGSYSADFSVVDAAGNRSNVIPFTINISAEIPRGTTVPEQVGRGGIIDRLVPAR